MRAATMTGPDLFAELDDQGDAAELAAAERDRAARVARLAAAEAAPVVDPAEADRARRAARLARETAELAERATEAERRRAEHRARPELAAWRARFERAQYIARHTREGLPVWGDFGRATGWVCPGCGHVEPDEGKLQREHGYDPDTVGRIPTAAAEFGDPGRCYRARLLASQAASRAEHNATCAPGAEWTHEIDGHPLELPVAPEGAPSAPVDPEALDSVSTLHRAANPDPNADPERAHLDAKYAGWVARQERRAEAERAAHAVDVEDQADELEPVILDGYTADEEAEHDRRAVETRTAREIELWRVTFARHDGWQCPSCRALEPTADALREHGYDPDQPGTMPPGVTVYGELGRCHLALIDQPARQLGPEDAAEWPAHNAGWMTKRHDWPAVLMDGNRRSVAILPARAACDGPAAPTVPDGALF